VRAKTIKFIALKLRNKNCTLSVSYECDFYLNPKFLGSTLLILILLVILASFYKMLSWGVCINYRLLYFLVKF